MSVQSLQSWLRLALAPEVGPVLGHRLLAALGSPEAIFAASRERLLAVPGVGPARVARLLAPEALDLARAEAQRLGAAGDVRLITIGDGEYPELLSRLPTPPLVLWVRGRLDPGDRLALAIVGPRNPSAYARLMTGTLARPLAAQGLTLISGLAYGIDSETHRAALEGGGRTLAVVGQGLGTPIYPQANAALARQIVEEDRGAIVSIFPMAAEPNPGLFPARNEIIAGLALGVLVVEASPSSGALITARHALAAERHVLACPGDATRRAAQGSNRLIADGAPLVQSADDVLASIGPELRREMEALGLAPRAAAEEADEGEWVETAAQETGSGTATIQSAVPGRGPAPRALRPRDALGAHLAALLAEEPLTVDLILDRCGEAGHAMPAVLERLLQMEIDGHIRQMPGRLYALASPPE